MRCANGPLPRPSDSSDTLAHVALFCIAPASCPPLFLQRLAAHHDSVLEELVPKATGREAQLEKRQQKGAYAHVDRDAGGLHDIPEQDLMGSGGNSEYQAMSVRESVCVKRSACCFPVATIRA